MGDSKFSLKDIGGSLIKKPSFNLTGEKKDDGYFSLDELPWDTRSSSSENIGVDPFFPAIQITPKNAEIMFPYRLIVFDVKKGTIPGRKSKVVPSSNVQKFTSSTGGVYFTSGKISEWVFTLPITPQQLSVTDEFAITTTATARGIVEEHNGVKFKMITASGTTGVWPSRKSFEDKNSGIGNTLFGGTVEALGGVVRAFDNLKNGKTKPSSSSVIDEGNQGRESGYFQSLMLQQFLERYAMAKKDPANKGWRLVFDCPKTNESFVVTPIRFTSTKSQKNPTESFFTIQLKAWKRIDLTSAVKHAKSNINTLDPNFFQTINEKLDSARSLMSASLNVIKAVRADFRKPFDTLRKVTLLVKDLAGLPLALADLPSQIASDITSATRKMSSDLNSAFNPYIEILTQAIGSRGQGAEKKVKKIYADIASETEKAEGDPNDLSALKTKENPNDDLAKNFDYATTVPVDALELSPEQKEAIQFASDLNSLISIEELKEMAEEIKSLKSDLANLFGAWTDFYSDINNLPAPKDRATDMTLEEYRLIISLEDVILYMNIFTSTRQLDDSRTENPLEYVGGLALESGIPFNSGSTGKYLAPVPFGLTMQEISERYLGNPDRYNEIITLNSLRSPYIDEDGFFYLFLTNGDGRQFNISSKENLFIGQKIQLSSNIVPMFTRKITAIEKITDINYLISVDGISDLNTLKVSDNATIKAYLPGTVNSQNQLYIPSDQPVTEGERTFDVPNLKEDTLTGLSKIDWLLDDSGDVVLNSFGEAALANGTNNLVQALKMKVNTAKGQILSDKDFGLGIAPGTIVNDLTISGIINDLTVMVTDDSRFSGVDKIEIELDPPSLSIKIEAVLANGTGVFPINFTVTV